MTAVSMIQGLYTVYHGIIAKRKQSNPTIVGDPETLISFQVKNKSTQKLKRNLKTLQRNLKTHKLTHEVSEELSSWVSEKVEEPWKRE